MNYHSVTARYKLQEESQYQTLILLAFSTLVELSINKMSFLPQLCEFQLLLEKRERKVFSEKEAERKIFEFTQQISHRK